MNISTHIHTNNNIIYYIHANNLPERLVENSWSTTVWNIEFDETVPCCFSRICQYIEARDRSFWPQKNSMRFPTGFRQPLTYGGYIVCHIFCHFWRKHSHLWRLLICHLIGGLGVEPPTPRAAGWPSSPGARRHLISIYIHLSLSLSISLSLYIYIYRYT